MRISIATKVFATLLAASTLVVAGMYVFMQRSFEQGFVDFVEARQQQRIAALSQFLAEEYQVGQGWERLRGDRRRWRHLLRRQPPPPPAEVEGEADHEWHGPEGSGPEARDEAAEHPRYRHMVLLDRNRAVVAGRVRQPRRMRLYPVRVGNDTVGYLGILPGPPARELAEIRFERRHMHSLLKIALAMLLLSTALGLPLAYTLVRPLRRIAQASRQLAQGRYETRLPVTSRDEIGQLAGDINDLAQALEETEQSRRQWVADISHELRTPLAVLRGEIEALQDGVRAMSPESLVSLHGEVMRLSRLVDELYQLSLADVGALSYHRQRIEPLAVLEETLATLADTFHDRDIEVSLDSRLERPVFCHADGERLSQLFRNLLINSSKYTDPGGRLELRVALADDHLVFDFRDSGPGVPDATLARLFERFYRVEPSRSRLTGGAGLGLAICRNIVTAHEGRISARHSPLGGLWIRVELPVTP